MISDHHSLIVTALRSPLVKSNAKAKLVKLFRKIWIRILEVIIQLISPILKILYYSPP